MGKDLFFAIMALNGDRDVALRFLVTESMAFSASRLQFGSANNKVLGSGITAFTSLYPQQARLGCKPYQGKVPAAA